jgi:DNA-binding MarR family transcriptional regulator
MSYLFCPEVVWSNDKLSINEKVLCGRIIGLSNKWGYCTASNKFFEDELNLCQKTISTYITRLEKLGFIKRVRKKDSVEIAERRLVFVYETPELHKLVEEFTIPLVKSTIPSPQNLLGTIDNTLDVLSSEDDNALATDLGISEPPIKVEKKSQKIGVLDRAINTAIIDEMKSMHSLVALPLSQGQQRIFANFIRKRYADALGQNYCKEEVIKALIETVEIMGKDKYLKPRIPDLQFFYYKMVLYSPLLTKKQSKEVYL